MLMLLINGIIPKFIFAVDECIGGIHEGKHEMKLQQACAFYNLPTNFRKSPSLNEIQEKRNIRNE